MKFVADSEGILRVTGLERLSVSNCADFKMLLQLYLNESIQIVELDCTGLRFIDSDGLGTLITIQKKLAARSGKVRLQNTLPVVRQLLHLLRLDEIFELTP